MNEQQRLFLVQARTDFAVFEVLRKNALLPSCHALHYLQMATELLGKALAWRHGPPRRTHRSLVQFLRSLTSNQQAQSQLGFENQNQNWIHVIRKSVPLAERVENLAPALCNDGPNAEYPWPNASPTNAPAEHTFDLWSDLQETAAGRQFLHLISRLFMTAETFL